LHSGRDPSRNKQLTHTHPNPCLYFILNHIIGETASISLETTIKEAAALKQQAAAASKQ
jgi:hypothetical protein